METKQRDRRRFLTMLGAGAGAVAVGSGCTAAVESTGAGGTGTGGTDTGGTDTGGGGDGAGGSTTTSTTTTSCAAPPGKKLGEPSDYAATGLHIVTNQGVLIGRDAGGLYALTAICTHQGCNMSTGAGQISGQDIRCTCHSSLFGPTGSVISGPAHTALRAFALALGCDGFLYVNTAQTVASTVRLMA